MKVAMRAAERCIAPSRMGLVVVKDVAPCVYAAPMLNDPSGVALLVCTTSGAGVPLLCVGIGGAIIRSG
jgi:hypothetical protein